MPGSVARNYRVAAGLTSIAGATTAYAVPAGYVLIVKYVAVTGASATTINGHARIAAAGLAEIRLRTYTVALNQTVEWSGQVVLNAGDLVLINGDAAGLYYWVSGALLSGFTTVPAGPVALPAGEDIAAYLHLPTLPDNPPTPETSSLAPARGTVKGGRRPPRGARLRP